MSKRLKNGPAPRLSSAFRLVPFLFVSLEVFAQAPSKHPVTTADLQSLKQADCLDLSPDGQWLAYVVQGDIWILATMQKGLPRKVGSGTFPHWSPDSKHLAYYHDDSSGFQLWLLSIETNEAVQLTRMEDGISPDPLTRIYGWIYDPLQFSWSPDGAKIVFASQVAIANQGSENYQDSISSLKAMAQVGGPLILTNNTPPEWTLRGVFRNAFGNPEWANWEKRGDSDLGKVAPPPPTKVNQLFVVDIHSKRVEQLTKDDAVYFNPDWSPDGKEIVCASTDGRSLRTLGANNIDLYAIAVSTGEKIALTKDHREKRLPAWSPDGKWIAFIGDQRFGMYQSVFVMRAGSGTILNVTKKLDRSIYAFRWSADGSSIIVVCADGVSWPIVRVDLASGNFEQIAGREPAVKWPMTISRTGSLAWQQSDGSSNGILHILPQGSQSPYLLVDLNPQIKEWELGSQEVLRWRNSRGEEMEGVLIKPIGYRTEIRYPLIVDAYPGTANTFKAWSMEANQEWASLGYVIFYPDPRAPHVWMNPFKSQAYDQAAKGRKGWEVTLDDVMSGVDELIKRGTVDPNRMGLYGFSNGGGVVNYLVTRTNRFKCAVSVAGVHPDWLLPFFLHTDSTIPTFAGGISPFEDAEAYNKLSAVFHLDKVRTPVLLAVGDKDGDFLLGAIEMYNGLRWLRKDVTFLRYADQEHGFTGAALEDFTKRRIAFLDKYLKPGQPAN